MRRRTPTRRVSRAAGATVRCRSASGHDMPTPTHPRPSRHRLVSRTTIPTSCSGAARSVTAPGCRADPRPARVRSAWKGSRVSAPGGTGHDAPAGRRTAPTRSVSPAVREADRARAAVRRRGRDDRRVVSGSGDRAGHVGPAAHRRFDLAVAVRALGDLHRRPVVLLDRVVHERRIAFSAGRVDGHSTGGASVGGHVTMVGQSRAAAAPRSGRRRAGDRFSADRRPGRRPGTVRA